MFSSLKVNLHENKPVNGDIIVNHADRMIMIREKIMIMVTKAADQMIGTVIEVRLPRGEIDCLTNSGKK